MHLICPLCLSPLALNEHGLSCSQRHHFDRAREGYFNLLPAQLKNSREPGDAKMQLQARRKFLAAGNFAPLLPVLNDLIPASTNTLLDIGCGDGYFTQAMQQGLADTALVYGIDIAKAGVKLAAKNHSGIYAVASSFALPIADRSMDVITRIYAPSSDAELLRVLKADGHVVIVTPASNHLLGLRKLIYANVRPHPEPVTPVGMRLVKSVQASFQLSIAAGEMAHALLQMTPFLWRISLGIQQQLVTEGIEDSADFHLSVYTPVGH